MRLARDLVSEMRAWASKAITQEQYGDFVEVRKLAPIIASVVNGWADDIEAIDRMNGLLAHKAATEWGDGPKTMKLTADWANKWAHLILPSKEKNQP